MASKHVSLRCTMLLLFTCIPAGRDRAGAEQEAGHARKEQRIE